MTDDFEESIRDRADMGDEKPLEVKRVEDRLNEIGPGVNNTTTFDTSTTIDFSVVDDVGLSPIDRMTDGRFASSLTVIHGGPGREPKIGTALIRFGSVGLKESGDEFLAIAELEEVVEGTDPPVPVNTRFREIASSYAGDVLHVKLEALRRGPVPRLAGEGHSRSEARRPQDSREGQPYRGGYGTMSFDSRYRGSHDE